MIKQAFYLNQPYRHISDKNKAMTMLTTLQLTPKHFHLHRIKSLTTHKSTQNHCTVPSCNTHLIKLPISFYNQKAMAAALVGTGLAITALVGPATAGGLALTEPTNALSLPTWAIHVSSVAEWSCLSCFAFLDFTLLTNMCVYLFMYVSICV